MNVSYPTVILFTVYIYNYHLTKEKIIYELIEHVNVRDYLYKYYRHLKIFENNLIYR